MRRPFRTQRRSPRRAQTEAPACACDDARLAPRLACWRPAGCGLQCCAHRRRDRDRGRVNRRLSATGNGTPAFAFACAFASRRCPTDSSADQAGQAPSQRPRPGWPFLCCPLPRSAMEPRPPLFQQNFKASSPCWRVWASPVPDCLSCPGHGGQAVLNDREPSRPDAAFHFSGVAMENLATSGSRQASLRHRNFAAPQGTAVLWGDRGTRSPLQHDLILAAVSGRHAQRTTPSKYPRRRATYR